MSWRIAGGGNARNASTILRIKLRLGWQSEAATIAVATPNAFGVAVWQSATTRAATRTRPVATLATTDGWRGFRQNEQIDKIDSENILIILLILSETRRLMRLRDLSVRSE